MSRHGTALRARRYDAVRRLVASHAPELSALDVRVLGCGEDHEAYAVGDLVVRFARSGDPAGTATRVAREAALLRVVAELVPVPVPVPVFVVEEQGCVAYRKLPGRPLVDVLYGEQRREAGVPRAAVARGLGALLRSLHAIPRARVAGIVEIDAFPPAAWLAEARGHYARLRDAVPRERRAQVELWLRRDPPGSDDAPALSHNDLGAEHVLADPRTGVVTGVIDWSDAAVVDRARDFGLLLRDLGPRGLALAQREYGSAGAALAARAWFFARCGVLEDLAFGLESGQEIYVRKSLAAMTWLFAAEAIATA